MKVDPDAPCFPNSLLREVEGYGGVAAQGVYFQNCKYVDYGCFGNFEVFSKIAFGTLLGNLDKCYTVAVEDWHQNRQVWPDGRGLLRTGVHGFNKGATKVEVWDLTTDGACEADRPEAQTTNSSRHAWGPARPRFTCSSTPRSTFLLCLHGGRRAIVLHNLSSLHMLPRPSLVGILNDLNREQVLHGFPKFEEATDVAQTKNGILNHEQGLHAFFPGGRNHTEPQQPRPKAWNGSQAGRL